MFNRRLRLFWPLVLIIAPTLLAQARGGAVTIHYAPGRTVPCIACGNPDPDCAAHSELHRSYLPDPHWADRDFWSMNPHLGTGRKNQNPSRVPHRVRHPALIWAQVAGIDQLAFTAAIRDWLSRRRHPIKAICTLLTTEPLS
jgi:hypothetical protein